MNTYLLRENVLTDNVLIVASKNKVFKGGYVAIIKENSFLNSWNDRETVIRFRSFKSLMRYLNKHYKEVVDDFDFTGTSLESVSF